MTSVTNLLPMEETLMRCMFGYIGTGLQKLCVEVRCCHLGMKMYTREDIQESLLITLLHFVIIFKTIQTISNWETRQILPVLVCYSSLSPMLNLPCVVCITFSWSFHRLGILSMFCYFFCFHVIRQFHSAWSSQENKNHGKVCWKPFAAWGVLS